MRWITQLNQTGIFGELYRPLQRSSAATCGRGDPAGDGGQATTATMEHHPIDPCLVRRCRARAGYACPCVGACRACVLMFLYDSCSTQQSTSARCTLISPGHVHQDRREAAVKRQTSDRDRQSALQRHNFGMFSVCNHTTAASCPLA
jgi:hypothetical protein